MANEFNKDEWMKSLNLQTEDEKKAAELLLANPERVKEIQRGWNSVSEGSRLAAEAQRAKAEADAAKLAAEEKAKNTDTYFQTLTQWEKDEKKTLAAETARRTAYEAYLKDIGVEPETALSIAGAGVQPSARKASEPVIDPKIFEEQKLLREQVTATASMLADLPFELQMISNKHAELYNGKLPPPEVMSKLKETYLNPQTTKPLMTLAAEEFHFADREKQLADEQLEKRVEQMLAEKTMKWESEHKLPTGALSAAETEPAVNMTSEKFASDIKRSSDADISLVSERDLAAFAAAEQDLAASGIRMTQ